MPHIAADTVPCTVNTADSQTVLVGKVTEQKAALTVRETIEKTGTKTTVMKQMTIRGINHQQKDGIGVTAETDTLNTIAGTEKVHEHQNIREDLVIDGEHDKEIGRAHV